MEDIISSVHHPVYHIRTAVIEALQGVVGKHTTKLIVGLGSYLEAVAFLCAHSLITLMGGTLVIKICKGGESEPLVVAGKEAPVAGGGVGEVDARIEAQAVVKA